MKTILTLIILFFCLNNASAQTIRDSVFNNVVLIKKTDISTNGNDFLIDIPIKSQKQSIIIYNDSHIPSQVFFDRSSFLPAQSEFILITPDWEFLKAIREEEKRKGIHIKAFRNKIYHIQRDRDGYKIDSLSMDIHLTKINFKNPELKENQVKYFFQECYGSTCCPRDPSWELKEERDEMKNNFNLKHEVSVYKNAYKRIMGKEGENCTYYTLDDLTNEQKMEFIFQSTKTTNPKTTDNAKPSIIILPSVINIENMKQLNP